MSDTSASPFQFLSAPPLAIDPTSSAALSPKQKAALTAVPTEAISTAPATGAIANAQDIESPGPLSLSLPAYQKSLSKQLASGPVADVLARYGPDITQQFLALQNQRLQHGNAPLPNAQAQAVINAAGTGSAVTPEPTKNFFQALTSDVTGLANSIPHIPAGLIHEVQALPEINHNLAALPAASSPTEFLGNLAAQPGFRLIPGSYIAQQFGSGPQAHGASGLLEHPLYSALDVLPYAESAAARSGVVHTAEDIALANATKASSAGLIPPKISVPPIRTFLKNVGAGEEIPEAARLGMDAAGNPILGSAQTPNALGNLTSAASEAIKKSSAGTLLKKLSPQTRDVSRLYNFEGTQISERPPATAPETAHLAYDLSSDINALLQENGVPGAATAAKLKVSLTQSNGVFDAAVPADIAPARDLLKTYADNTAAARVSEGQLGAVAHATGPEFYPPHIASTINKYRDLTTDNSSLILDHYTDPDVFAGLTPQSQSAITRLQSALPADDWSAAMSAVRDLRNSPDKFDPLPYADTLKALHDVSYHELANTPARFTPIRQQMALDELLKALPDDDPAKLLAVNNQLYSQAGFTPEEIKATMADVPSWKELQALGADPTWVPSTTPAKAYNLAATPRPMDFNPTLAATKERLMDAQGTINDPLISFAASAKDDLVKYASEQLVSHVTQQFAVRESELLPRYLEALSSEDVLRNQFMDPKAQATAWMAEEGYVPYNPGSYFNPSVAHTSASSIANERLWIPKNVLDTLDELTSPKTSAIGKLVDPLMKTFRTSVLTLSPRFYINNLAASAMMGAVQLDNPLHMISYLDTVKGMIRDPDAMFQIGREGVGSGVAEISGQELHGLGGMAPRSARSSLEAYGAALDPARPGVASTFLHQYLGGATQRRLFEAASANPLTQLSKSAAGGGALDKLKTAAGTIDATMEDFSNIVGALEGAEKSLASGETREQAILRGIEAGNKFFGSKWIDLTPMERTVIKNIVPFYSFARVMMKYVAQLPATHPWRLSIMSNLNKAEEADWGSGLPQQFRKLFSIGPVAADGTQKSIDIGGVNPFQDLGGYASLIGFMAGGSGDMSAITRSLNPVLSTALTSLGVDTSRGQADLYPQLYLDPASGQMAAKTGNPVLDLAQNVLPASGALTALIGKNDQFKAVLRTNPEAAGRTLASNFGIPLYEKDINSRAQIMKAESARYTQSRKVLADALKTGDWDEAKKWSSLVPILKNIAALPPGQIEAMALQSGASPAEAAKAALLPGNMTGK